jgi:transcriptional regulator with XRE-family HTH domain
MVADALISGIKFRAARKKLHLSQEELAQKLGMTTANVRRVEKAEATTIRTRWFRELAGLLAVSFDDLGRMLAPEMVPLFGKKLTAFRDDVLRVSQDDLAPRIGLDVEDLALLEAQDVGEMPAQSFRRLAEVRGVSAEELRRAIGAEAGGALPGARWVCVALPPDDYAALERRAGERTVDEVARDILIDALAVPTKGGRKSA